MQKTLGCMVEQSQSRIAHQKEPKSINPEQNGPNRTQLSVLSCRHESKMIESMSSTGIET